MEKRDLDIIFANAVNWRMYMDTTVLVTGATGRIGMYILEALVEADLRYNLNMRIIGLARSPEKAASVFGNTMELPNVNFIYQDVSEPIEADGRIDYIFHTAGPAAPVDFRDIPAETLWAHVAGMHNVLELARLKKVRRVFYTSTVEVYGDCKADGKMDENYMGPVANLSSRACYPEAKRIAETMLVCYKAEYGISFCGCRMSHTLGAGISLTDGRAFAEFIADALAGRDIVLNSDGSAVRPYTYVADAVNAMFIIMDKGEDRFYNVASDDNLISIRDLAALVASLSPSHKTSVIAGEGTKDLPYLPYRLATMDTSAVRSLGWRPRVSIEDTIKWTMESFM